MKDLIPVLESLSICTAISLDDDYDVAYNPTTQGMLRVDILLSSYRKYFEETEISEINDSGVITISDLIANDTISPGTKDRVTALLTDMKEHQAPSALQFLEDEFEDSTIEFQKMPTMDGLSFNSEKGTIWFIDKEIRNHEILQEIVPLISKKCNRIVPIIIIVFTSDINLAALNTSWHKRHDYLVNDLAVDKEIADWLSYSFFVVLKKEIEDCLPEDKAGAQAYLDGILSASMSGYCTYQIIQEIRCHGENAVKRLLKAAKESNQKTFQNIQYNMVMEGEPNVYHAIKSILDYMQEREYLDGFEQCSRYLSAMKRLAHNPKQDTEAISAQSLEDILRNYEWAQFQFIHKDVNRTFADIAHGDVFKLNCSIPSDECRPYIGILITQSCDCIIRKDKEKTNRKATHFTLVLYEEKRIRPETLEQPDVSAGKTVQSDWKNRIKKLRDRCIILSSEAHEDGIIASYIDVGAPITAIQILPFVLDLASLNKEGKAVLLDQKDMEQALKQYKTHNWQEYCPELKREVTKHKAQIESLYKKLGEEADEFVRSLYGITFSQQNNQFSIQRVGHLEDNMAELISYNYLTRTYRAGKNSLLSLNFNSENGEGDF